MARDGRLTCPICTMFSIRVRASRAAVSMHRGDRTVMAGVHRLQHVKRFRAAHLAYDDPVRTHAQRIPHQIALRHLPRAFEAGRPGLQADHVRLLELQLCRILDGDNAFAVIDELAQGVQQRRLAGTGAARDQNIEPRAGGDLQQIVPWPGSLCRFRSFRPYHNDGLEICGWKCRGYRSPAAGR